MHKTSTIMSKKLVNKPVDCSDFQLHKNMLVLPKGSTNTKLLDFTEFKLRRMIKMTPESDRRRALLELLADYQLGKIAIAWQGGANPIYITIHKDA